MAKFMQTIKEHMRTIKGKASVAARMQTIKGKIVVITMLLLIASNITIGLLAYNIASDELDTRGKTVLQNAVEMSLQMIELANQDVEDGTMTLDEAQEQVKTYLLGEKQPDGTRVVDTPFELGETGHMTIYTQEADVVTHPTQEGANLWDSEDKSTNSVKLVQDSIQVANEGGGFTYYDWDIPKSDEIGTRIVYNQLDPTWGWVVTAGSYENEFNVGAMHVLQTTAISILIFLVIAGVILYLFADRLGKALGQVKESALRLSNLDITQDISESLTNRND